MRPLQWWAESAPFGGERVKVSENLGATSLALVAPVNTSLMWPAHWPISDELWSLHNISRATYLMTSHVSSSLWTLKNFSTIMTFPGPAFKECTGSCHENVPASKAKSSNLHFYWIICQQLALLSSLRKWKPSKNILNMIFLFSWKVCNFRQTSVFQS